MARPGGWPPTGFGGRLKKLREERSLTQQELAKRSGCHAMTIAKLERGAQEPAWPLVLALARALAVTCEAFSGEAPAEAQAARLRGRPRKQLAPTDQAEPKRPKKPRRGKGT